RRREQSFQPSSVTVKVVDSLARYPLANADVIDLVTGQHRFTDERGQAVLTWPSSQQLRLRVRQVGYQPRQRTLDRGVAGTDATFEMTKVAYVLSTVRATSRCSIRDDTTSHDLSLAVLDQLKQGAEKYEEFRKLYPFELTVEHRIAAVPPDSQPPQIIATTEKFRSDNFEARYKPGDIIEYSRGTFHVPILFLSTLADSVFWENHCFVASGSQTYNGQPIVRLDFSPRRDLITTDYEGSAFLDSATSYLRRVDFRLTNLYDRRGPNRLEGYITYTSPSPYVVVPDTTIAIWWVRKVGKDDWGKPDYVQRLKTQELKYRKEKPPGYESVKQ
ncbi:MAG TPA: hypothetical protein VGN73_01915, partial [Gemmatimonadaceae bacterium]|nr:hypothetical protein [Gemmatimonadaceae bacterium]